MSGYVTGLTALGLILHLWWRADAGPWSGPDISGIADPFGQLALAAALLLIFTALHSFFASHAFKRWLGLPPSRERKLYLTLNLGVTAVVWLLWSPVRDLPLWSLSGAPGLVLRGAQALGLVGFAWTARTFDIADFFGSRRRAQSSAAAGELVESGPYALCRHPSYFFTLLLLASPHMGAGRALLAFSFALYIVVGSRLEERKLLAEWGDSYAVYRERTPWLVPTPASIRRALRLKRVAQALRRKWRRSDGGCGQ